MSYNNNSLVNVVFLEYLCRARRGKDFLSVEGEGEGDELDSA